MPYRQTFDQIFRRIDDNTLEVLRKIKVGSVEFDVGAHINRGVLVAGLDFFKFLGGSLEGDDVNGGDTFDVKLVYPA
jgi:hypothetical protein